MATTCFDEPKDILDSDTCIGSLSKDMHGEIEPTSSTRHECRHTRCISLRTSAVLKAKLTTHAPCDGLLAQPLAGLLTVAVFATAYEKDGLGRGVHAGDFVWAAAPGVEIRGRMSGITNAGLVRGKPFDPAIEKCVSEGVLVGRLCGEVTRTENAKLKGAKVVAVYRCKTNAAPNGESGKLIGTLEGVLVTPC